MMLDVPIIGTRHIRANNNALAWFLVIFPMRNVVRYVKINKINDGNIDNEVVLIIVSNNSVFVFFDM